MMDTLTIGPVPYEEPCQQVGTPSYDPIAAKQECQRYKRQLERLFPPPDGCRFIITSNPHDFGTYYEVACRYSEESKEAVEWAHNAEDNSPAKWDRLALYEAALEAVRDNN